MTNAHGFLLDSSLGGMPPLAGLLFPGCTGCLALRCRPDSGEACMIHGGMGPDSCFKGFPESDLMLSEGYDSVPENILMLLKCYDSISENVLMLLKGYDSIKKNVLLLS